MSLLALLLQAPPGAEQGIVTFYHGPRFEGNPLRCGGIYAEETGPWLAVDAGWLGSRVECGDPVLVGFPDGSVEVARVMDTGRLAEHGVVADLPSYWRRGRATGPGWILSLDNLMERMN